MEWISPAFSALAEIVFQKTAAVILPVISGGRVRVAPIGHDAQKPGPFSIQRRSSTIIIGEIWAIIAGLLFWMIAGFLLFGILMR